jgi:hypothetical protein
VARQLTLSLLFINLVVEGVTQLWFAETFLPHFTRQKRHFLYQMAELVDLEGKQVPWSDIHCNRQQSIDTLKQRAMENGVSCVPFLLRYSKTYLKSFSLDVITSNGIKHYVVENNEIGV